MRAFPLVLVLGLAACNNMPEPQPPASTPVATFTREQIKPLADAEAGYQVGALTVYWYHPGGYYRGLANPSEPTTVQFQEDEKIVSVSIADPDGDWEVEATTTGLRDVLVVRPYEACCNKQAVVKVLTDQDRIYPIRFVTAKRSAVQPKIRFDAPDEEIISALGVQ